MRKTHVFAAILSLPLILAPITPLARSFIPASISYVLPTERHAGVTLTGKNWAYTVPFSVHNKMAIKTLIQCESQGVNISRPDSDGVISDGILQFHRASSTPGIIGSGTWDWMASLSGIKGSPINPADAIKMADFAISRGLGGQWTCWHLTHLDGSK